jgi:hypothetical protein
VSRIGAGDSWTNSSPPNSGSGLIGPPGAKASTVSNVFAVGAIKPCHVVPSTGSVWHEKSGGGRAEVVGQEAADEVVHDAGREIGGMTDRDAAELVRDRREARKQVGAEVDDLARIRESRALRDDGLGRGRGHGADCGQNDSGGREVHGRSGEGPRTVH